MIRHALARVFIYNMRYILFSLIIFGKVTFLTRNDKARISKVVYVQTEALFVVTNLIRLRFVSH